MKRLEVSLYEESQAEISAKGATTVKDKLLSHIQQRQ